jgi:hypothetical protein
MTYIPQTVTFPASNEADLSLTEGLTRLNAVAMAQVHLLAQMVALQRGLKDPIPEDEGDMIVAEFLNPATRTAIS